MFTANLSSLFLAAAAPVWVVVVLAVAIVVVGAACVFVGWFFNKKSTEKKVGEVNQRIKLMLEEAENEAKALKKEAILEAKEQDLKLRNEFERETKEKKAELQKAEQRLMQKEDNVDKKEDALQKKSDALEQQQKNLARQEGEIKKMQEKVNHQHDLMLQELEKVAQLTREEAKKALTENILEETRHDVAVQVRNIEQRAKDEADQEAKKIISLAIQRCASDHASEITVSVVPLPNDDMKARIIGREGRNIRALENATGIELIIDDTPEVVILSGFDPVRREVARLALEKLATIPADFEYIAIHDGARPFVSSQLIIRTLAAATIAGGAVPALPVTDAVKRIGADGMFAESISRQGLVTVQTPQIFRKSEILDAYDRFPLPEADDDAAVHMWAGYRTTFSPGSPENRKITFLDDIPDAREQAERYLKERDEGRRSAAASRRMRELMAKGDDEE